MTPRSWLRVVCLGGVASLLLTNSLAGQTVQRRLSKFTPAPDRRPVAMAVTPRVDLAFSPTADLAIGMRVLVDPSRPAGTGEFPVVFRDAFSISEDSLRQDDIWIPFRWSTAAGGVESIEWQVVTNPMTVGLEDWRYPAGIVARGRVGAVPATAGAAVYFVVDFKPILGLPAGYALGRPQLAPRPANIGVVRRMPTPAADARVRRLRDLRGSGLKLSPSTGLKLSTVDAQFAREAAAHAEHRWRYLRIVLLGSGGRAIGVSRYVSLQVGAPGEIEVHPEALPTPYVPPPPVKAPDFSVARYTGPSFPPGDPAGRYIVLANCPKWLQDNFGWTPGMQVHLEPDRDKGVLESVGDAIDSAVSSLADLVNWFSKTWDDLKSRFIEGICFGNDDCAKIAAPLLDAGLAAMGVPPEIPNFNELCGLGADYLAAYIASQYPIPEELARESLERMADIVNNPPGGSGGAFLWPDPAYQEKPAMVTLEVHNPRGEPSDPITVRLAYGAQRGQESGFPHFATFLDTSTPIPSLAPGQRMTIPVVLTVNPEIRISHGNDTYATWFGRNIQIYRLGYIGEPPLFSSSQNWWAHDVTH